MKTKPIPLVSADDKDAWHRERGKGVTKTDVTRLVSGTLASKRAVHADKTGGKTFHGNQHTERGRTLEPAVAEWVEAEYGIPPSQVLYAHGENHLHRATPDCYQWTDGEGELVEIKTTNQDWSAGLPQKIVDDVLWQRYVLGAGFSAVAVLRTGANASIEPEFIEVPDDPERTAFLIKCADDYLAWVADGCPDVDSDVPVEVRDAAEEVAAAKVRIAELEAVVKAWAEAQPDAATVGVKREIPGAVIALTVTHGKEFDEAKARADHTELFAVLDHSLTVLAEIKKDKDYLREKVGRRWSISAPKEGAAA